MVYYCFTNIPDPTSGFSIATSSMWFQQPQISTPLQHAEKPGVSWIPSIQLLGYLIFGHLQIAMAAMVWKKDPLVVKNPKA